MMKGLVIYYSRTGTTKRVANEIAKVLNFDTEEIIDIKNRKGMLGYILAGRDGTFKRKTEITKVKYDPSFYDLVIIGTPIWVSVSPAIRTYLTNYGNKIKTSAFFCTMGGSGGKKAFEDMEEILRNKQFTTVEFTTSEVDKNRYQNKFRSFIEKITSYS